MTTSTKIFLWLARVLLPFFVFCGQTAAGQTIIPISSLSLSGPVQRIAVFGNSDRRTQNEWAVEKGLKLDEVQERYAATGLLKCNGAQLSANLVLADDLIVTSAHAFTNPETCKKISDFRTCRFSVKLGNKEQVVELDKLVAQGLKCPATTSIPSDDWAVVRLKEKIVGVVPYAVDGPSDIKRNQRVTSVSSINLDLFKDGLPLPPYTKTIGSCYTQKIYTVSGQIALFSSDCDGTQGGSGGAVLNDDDLLTPVLLGIHTSISETPDIRNAAIRSTGAPARRDFEEKDWANNHVALKSRLLYELITANSKR